MKRWRNAAGPAAVAVLVAAIFCTLPLGTALEFGRDEGYELMKGLLHSRGFQLYKEIWSDQPPLFTLLLSAAFGEFGASILVGRLVAAGFGLAFFMTFYSLVRQRSGHWPAAFAAFLLLSSPTVLELSVSVMQEVPAFAVALISAWLLVQWSERRRWPWLLASGAAMGVALEIKLTAAVLVPAMLTQAALAAPAKSNGVRARRTWLGPSLWGAATLGWFLAIALLWGRGSLHAFWGADVAPHAVLGLKRPEDFPIQWSLFLDHAECVVAAVAGTVWALKGGQWKEIAFPLVMLATALGIHAAHRPWWIYYYLHFAVPLSGLVGKTHVGADRRALPPV
jgi:4-amino-4-deoxy-L-arabinose transferase-like glycosyltransferase